LSTYNTTQADFRPKSLKPGENRRLDLDFSCFEIGQKAEKKVEIKVVPKRGSSDSYELTCEDCCLSLLSGYAECEREACE